jgi:N-acetylglutamate synthase-like GNAT family acetyltransferase
MTALSITTIRQRPDLLPLVAKWLWREFWNSDGYSLQQTQAIYAECVAKTGAPQTFVLLEDELPVGTATLAREDLDERPDLTPWLAGVFIVPDRRGRGYVNHLLSEFERACRTASIDVAWLYTTTADRVYAQAGWETVEVIKRPGKLPITLMRRAIPGGPAPSN